MGKKGSGKNSVSKKSTPKQPSPNSKAVKPNIDVNSDSIEAVDNSAITANSDTEAISSNGKNTNNVTPYVAVPTLENSSNITESTSEASSIDQKMPEKVDINETTEAVPVVDEVVEIRLSTNVDAEVVTSTVIRPLEINSSNDQEKMTATIVNEIEPALAITPINEMKETIFEACQSVESSLFDKDSCEKAIIDTSVEDNIPVFNRSTGKTDFVVTEPLVNSNTFIIEPITISDSIPSKITADFFLKETPPVVESVIETKTIVSEIATDYAPSVDEVIKEAVLVVDDVIEEAISIVDNLAENRCSIDETLVESTIAEDENLKVFNPLELTSDDIYNVDINTSEPAFAIDDMPNKASAVADDKTDYCTPATDSNSEINPLDEDDSISNIEETIEQAIADAVENSETAILITEKNNENRIPNFDEATLEGTLEDENFEETFTFIDKSMTESIHGTEDKVEENSPVVDKPVVEAVPVVDEIEVASSFDVKSDKVIPSPGIPIKESDSYTDRAVVFAIPVFENSPENLPAVEETADSPISSSTEKSDLLCTNIENELAEVTSLVDEKLEGLPSAFEMTQGNFTTHDIILDDSAPMTVDKNEQATYAIDEIAEKAISFVDEVIEISSIVDANIEEATSITDEVIKEATSITDEVIKEAASIADKVIKEVASIADEVTNEATSIIDEVTNEATSITDEVIKEAAHITDEGIEEATSVIDEATEEANSITNEVVEEATFIVDKNDEKAASFVDENVEEFTSIVDENIEEASSIAGKNFEVSVSLIDEKLEEPALLNDANPEDSASLIDEKLEESALPKDENPEDSAPLIDEKLEEPALLNDKNPENSASLDNEKPEDSTRLIDENPEDSLIDGNLKDFTSLNNENLASSASLKNENSEDVAPIDEKLEDDTPVFDEKIEDVVSIADENDEASFINEENTEAGPDAVKGIEEFHSSTYEVTKEFVPTANETTIGFDEIIKETVSLSDETAPVVVEAKQKTATDNVVEEIDFATKPAAENSHGTAEPTIESTHLAAEPIIENIPAATKPVTKDLQVTIEPVLENAHTFTESEVDNAPDIEANPEAAEPAAEIAQFCAFSSSINLVFWPHVTKLKLEVIKLNSDQLIPISGTYSCLSRKPKSTDQTESLDHILPFLMIDEQSLATLEHQNSTGKDTSDTLQHLIQCKLPGQLRVVDHKEELIKLRKEFTHQVTAKMLDEMSNNTVLHQPGLFGQFFLSCYLDIKKYVHSYHFFFPALRPTDPQHTVIPPCSKVDSKPRSYSLSDVFSIAELNELNIRLVGFLKALKPTELIKFGGFFLCKKITNQDSIRFEIDFLSRWDDFLNMASDTETSEFYVGFADPSPKADNLGWPLRNFLYFATRFKQLNNVKLIRIHFNTKMIDLSASYFTEIALGYCPSDEVPPTSGWEIGTGKKASPRTIDVSQMLNPEEQANSAVQLNLQLMRWRAEPNADLGIISNSKCLVLGAGTLGTYVARSLMAWGVNSISFVDNGKVSFSNPVRQPLYEYQDCLSGGKYKAEAAAQALLRIHPKINAVGHNLMIPMPGHALTASERTKVLKEVEQLDRLIKDHDVIFLLTDSRESRWLPTLLASYHNKLLLNAALGFDTFMVMRHGIRDSNDWKESPNLGCYFCTDVVAPTDSLSDRTLDEQCTVTRPGIAALASSLAAEMMVSVLQHPLKGLANPPSHIPNQKEESVLELNRLAQVVPHQIRYFLSKFNSLNLVGQSYPQCTACSEKVLEAYHVEGFEFLEKVFSDPHYLTKVTGLDSLLENIEDINVSESNSDLDDFEVIPLQSNIETEALEASEKIQPNPELLAEDMKESNPEDNSINSKSTDMLKEKYLGLSDILKNGNLKLNVSKEAISKSIDAPQSIEVETVDVPKEVILESTAVPQETMLESPEATKTAILESTESSKGIISESTKENNLESTKLINKADLISSEPPKEVLLESSEATIEVDLVSGDLSKQEKCNNLDLLDALKVVESETKQENSESSEAFIYITKEDIPLEPASLPTNNSSNSKPIWRLEDIPDYARLVESDDDF